MRGSITDKSAIMICLAEIRNRRDQIIAVAKRYGASDVRIFGSVARGEADAQSDVDILVRFEPDRSLLDQGGLLMELRELLGTRVDVVSEGALSGRFGQIVLSEAAPI
jgi:predicted nucleotidyltransferase